ncbi:MAG: polysaccharide pyruvyl transferase family protein [Elusimicrobia bacterium]|nr:polysaccharide pyruvyl transferase family protein [Elusimicrobiota bacterium]
MNHKFVAVGGYFGCGNFGDDWLCEAWRGQNAESEIVVWKKAFPSFKGFGRLKRVVFLGGLLQDMTSLRSLVYYFGVAALGRFLAQDGIIFEGASVGPIIHPVSRKLLAWFLKDTEKVEFCVRDRASFDFLLRLNPLIRCFQVLDPTWTCPLPTFLTFTLNPSPPPSPSRGEGIPENFGFFLNGSLRSREFLDMAGRVVRAGLDTGPVFLFLCDPKHDSRQADRLCRHLNKDLPRVAYSGNTNAFIGQIKTCRAVVSWRLHGAIAAMRLGIPAASLQPHPTDRFDKLRTLVLPEGFQFEWFEKLDQLTAWIKTH